MALSRHSWNVPLFLARSFPMMRLPQHRSGRACENGRPGRRASRDRGASAPVQWKNARCGIDYLYGRLPLGCRRALFGAIDTLDATTLPRNP